MKVEKDVSKEAVVKSDNLELDSWDKSRSTEQLLGFIARREAVIAGLEDED